MARRRRKYAMTFKEIAEELGCSTQNISQIYNKAMEKIKKDWYVTFDKDGFVEFVPKEEEKIPYAEI